MDRVVMSVASLGIPLEEVLVMATIASAKSVGLEGAGCLEPGCLADFVVLDGELEVVATFVGGVQVYP